MNVIGVILGGGTGSRLKPLTVLRAKPAVPLGGKYRLVDVPISNCINSGIYKIYMLTQYNSGSLHYHVQSAYKFDAFTRGFVRLLAAEQTPDSKEWFQGTADAVRQSMHHLSSSRPDIAVILSGDQLFRMDFQHVINQHIQKKADITICTTPVNRKDAHSLGILKTQKDSRITCFVEKPGPDELDESMRAPSQQEMYLASMGIYVFNFSALEELLAQNLDIDFGNHIIPQAIQSHRVFGYIFEGYWKDIGTIGSFWKTNLELTGQSPVFSFYSKKSPIYTRPRFLPPSQLYASTFEDCLLTEGVKISRAHIKKSVVGLRSIINEGAHISNAVIMGNDYYDYQQNTHSETPLGLGKNCRIDSAIIDKNVCIGNNVSISPHGLGETSTQNYTVRDGVIVIPKGTYLPDDTVIGSFPEER